MFVYLPFFKNKSKFLTYSINYNNSCSKNNNNNNNNSNHDDDNSMNKMYKVKP